MPNLMPIGQFSRITGLPARTLRFYDEIALLQPAVVDPFTGYRYYLPSQVEHAHQIARLRSVDLPLNEIQTHLLGDTEQAEQVLSRHMARLTARIHKDQQGLDLLRKLLQGKETPMTYHVHLKDISDTQALVVRSRVETPEESGPQIVHAFTRELWPHIKRHSCQLGSPYFFACHDLEGEGGPAELEMVVPVQGEVQGTGRIEVAQIPGGRFACTLHEGPYEEMGAAYRAVVAWVEAQGLEIVHHSREVYLVDDQVTDDPQRLRTEVMYQVR